MSSSSSRVTPATPPRADTSAPPAGFPAGLQRAGWAFKLRRMRDRIFGADLFGEPSWDVLLLLASARDADESLTLGRIALETHLPRETARHTVSQLHQAGLIAGEATVTDGLDARLRLSDLGYAKLQSVLG